MFEIRLSEQLFHDAQRRAAEGGYANVDEHVSELLRSNLGETENFDHLFTPERLAHMERVAAEMDAGKGLSLEEMDTELARRRTEWLNQNHR